MKAKVGDTFTTIEGNTITVTRITNKAVTYKYKGGEYILMRRVWDTILPKVIAKENTND